MMIRFLSRSCAGRARTRIRTRATSACWLDGRLGVLDFGAVARLPDGFPAHLRQGATAHAPGGDSRQVSRDEFSVARHLPGTGSAFTWQRCAPSWHRSPSRPGQESFRFSREMAAHRDGTSMTVLALIQRAAAAQPAALLRTHPPGTGSRPGRAVPARMRAPFRAEVLRWLPGYADPANPAPRPGPACARSASPVASAPPARPQQQARPQEQARPVPPAGGRAAGGDGTASAPVASWARTDYTRADNTRADNIVVRAVEGHHG